MREEIKGTDLAIGDKCYFYKTKCDNEAVFTLVDKNNETGTLYFEASHANHGYSSLPNGLIPLFEWGCIYKVDDPAVLRGEAMED